MSKNVRECKRISERDEWKASIVNVYTINIINEFRQKCETNRVKSNYKYKKYFFIRR